MHFLVCHPFAACQQRSPRVQGVGRGRSNIAPIMYHGFLSGLGFGVAGRMKPYIPWFAAKSSTDAETKMEAARPKVQPATTVEDGTGDSN